MPVYGYTVDVDHCLEEIQLPEVGVALHEPAVAALSVRVEAHHGSFETYA